MDFLFESQVAELCSERKFFMQKITTHSKSGLFLMEMIFVLLFLGLTCGVCVRLFAASYTARVKAREDSHIQELITNAGEILEGTDGTVQSFLNLMPDGVADQDRICYYFDKQWKNTAEENAVYKMEVVFSASDTVKEVQITFAKLQGANEENSLYTQTIRFPISTAKEGSDS